MPKRPEAVDSKSFEIKSSEAASPEALPQGYDAQRAKTIGANPLVDVDPITGTAPQAGLEKDAGADRKKPKA